MLPCLLRQKYRNTISGASPKRAHLRAVSLSCWQFQRSRLNFSAIEARPMMRGTLEYVFETGEKGCPTDGDPEKVGKDRRRLYDDFLWCPSRSTRGSGISDSARSVLAYLLLGRE
jgi:hypothetical protein